MKIISLCLLIIVSLILTIHLFPLENKETNKSITIADKLEPLSVDEPATSLQIPCIDDYFTISSLSDYYGDTLQEKVNLDSDIISYNELSYLEVLHYGFDGETHQGELIVNKKVAEEVLQIFKELYEIQFPIEKMRVISHYNNSDEQSMADNNTSAFNFRMITNGHTPSNHAFGLAIDINPTINPYIYKNTVLPENAGEYIDRNQEVLGLITADSEIYQIFKKYGWSWGGDWDTPKDYQHFEKTIN